VENKTFKELEHDGWIERAASYEFITPVTDQAIEPIFESFGELDGKHLLEVASGPGHLAGHAASLGAKVNAVDFAITMVEHAQSRYPDVHFREGDAEHLDFADNRFDGVICAFGLLHLAHPDLAVAEAFRVLKPGGRYTYTVWCSPDQGGEFFGFLMGAIQQHGDLNVPLPPSPPFYRFADPQEVDSVLEKSGFAEYKLRTIPIIWRAEKPSDAVDVIYKATVRTKLMLDAQTDSARSAIHEAIISGMDKFRVDDHFEIALPATMVSATKPT
jgi:ubiquinone/menaquinone biosynthesis C-methylase UbiE